jgi:PAS domain S-box-containing protein
MKKVPEKKYIITGFIIALLILVAVNIVIYLNIRFHFQDEKIITQSLTIIQSSETLFSNIIEAETNRRGYLITNNYEFIKEYYPALNSIDSSFANLKSIVYEPSSKYIIDSLRILIFNRKDLLEESLELQEKKSNDVQAQIEYTKISKLSIDRIKDLIGRIQNTEKKILDSRLREAEISSKYTLTNLVIGNVVAFGLLILAIFMLNRSINQRSAAEQTLEENRKWLATTLESIGDAVIVISRIGEILFLNKAAEKLTCWKNDDAKGLLLDHVFNIRDEESGRKIESPLRKVLSHGEITRFERNAVLVTKKGSLIPIDSSAAPIINDEGASTGVVLVFRDISERRKAEKEILDSQKFIKRITNSIPSVIYIYDLHGPRISYTNYKVFELLGYTSQEIKGMNELFFENLVHKEDVLKLKSLYKMYTAAKDSDIIDYEYRIRNSEGRYKWFRSYDVVFSRNNDGTVKEMLGTAFDVTGRKKLEEELQKYSGQLEELVDMRTGELRSANKKLQNEINERTKAERNIIHAEEKFRNLVENALVGIYILQDNKYVYVNPKYEEIFGYDHGEMTGLSSWNNVHDDYKDIVAENIRKRTDNEVESIQYGFKALKKDGTEIDVEVKGKKMMYNGKIAIIGTLQDISERLQAERELKNQREYLRTVIDTDPNFVFAKDWNGRFTLVNRAVAENYGTTTEGLIGKTDADFNPNEEEIEHFLKDDREVISTGKSKFISEEMVTNSKTKETRWYQTIKVPLKSSNGKFEVLGVAADITARKLAEEITKRSLKEKEMLLREIHHRVKNNLQIIVSLLKLQSKFVYDKRDLAIFNKSRSRVETMSLIHEKLYKSADISEINIGNYLSDLTAHLLKAYKVNSDEVEYSIKADKILVGIDTAIPCGLILNELINNILKHAFPEGHRGVIDILLKKCGEDIILEVSDNGTGIPDSFNTEDSDSLGMQLIDTLVKQLEGNIEIDNSSGTSFKITIKEIKYRERI